MTLSASARRRQANAHCLEALESRIAPANLTLAQGAGPYRLEVDPVDSHIHVLNGSGTEVFDAGTTLDDLFVDGSTVTDSFSIQQSTAGTVTLTGNININFNGALTIDGLNVKALDAVAASVATTGIVNATEVQFFAKNGISIAGNLTSTGLASVALTADGDLNGSGTFTLVAGGGGLHVVNTSQVTGLISISANDVSLNGAITTDATGRVKITPATNLTVDLGTNSAGHLGLTDAELDLITADRVEINNPAALPALISAVISPANYRVLQLNTASFDAAGGFAADVKSAAVYEHIESQGSVTINPGATLTVNALNGFVPRTVDTFNIVDLATGTVTGTFSGQVEGSLIGLGGATKKITYLGNGGRDVVLQGIPTIDAFFQVNQLMINDLANAANDLRISSDGSNTIFFDPNEIFANPGRGSTLSLDGRTLTVPSTALLNVLAINLAGGTDALTVDFTGGNPLPVNGLTFDAGTAGAPETLTLQGGAQGAVTHTILNASSGTLNVGAFGLITYFDTGKVVDTGSISSLNVLLPESQPNAVTLADDGTIGNGFSRLSAASIPTFDFKDPTNGVTIRPGMSGDSLTAAALPDWQAALSLSANFSNGAKFGAVTLNGDITFGAGKNLNVFAAGTVTVNGNNRLAVSGLGAITVETNRNILLGSGAKLETSGGVIDLTAQGTASGNYAGIEVSGTVAATNQGAIFLKGTGGNTGSGNYGILQLGQITNTDGNISLNGTGGAGTDMNSGLRLIFGSITGGGDSIDFVGIPGADAGNTVGIDLRIPVTGGAAISLRTDAGLLLDSGTNLNAGSQQIFVTPLTANQPIDLGTFHRTSLGLDNFSLNKMVGSFINIGDLTTGLVTISDDINSRASLSISANGVTGPGDITIPGPNGLLFYSRGNVDLSGAIATAGRITFIDAPIDIDVTMTNAGNDFSEVAVHTGGTVRIRNDHGFAVGAQASVLLALESAGTITQLTNANDLTFSGGGDLLKSGDGSLQLSRANQIGDTTISRGTIFLNNANALGTGLVTLGDVNTAGQDVSLFVTTGVSVINDISVPSLSGGSVAQIGTAGFTGAGATLFGGQLALNRPTILVGFNPSGTQFLGQLSGNVGTLSITSGHLVGLRGTNTFTGNIQVIGSGTTLQVNEGANPLPDASDVSVGPGAFLYLNKTTLQNETINRLTGSGTVGTSPLAVIGQQLTVAASSNFTFAGTLEDGGAPFSITKSGAATFTLTGDNTYTGTTSILSGTLALALAGSDNNIATSSEIALASGATLDVTGLGGQGVPTQTFSLSAGQRLLGEGTITGSLTGNGLVQPRDFAANSPGVLTITGDFAPSGPVLFDVRSPYNTAGVDFSRIVVTGTVDLADATLQFTGADEPAPVGQAIQLITRAAAGSTSPFANVPQGGLVHSNRAAFFANYTGGDGNDFVITRAVGQISLQATFGAGKLTVTDVDPSGRTNLLTYRVAGSNLVISDLVEFFATAPAGGQLLDGGHTLSLPLTASLQRLEINAGGGDDSLVVDFATGGQKPFLKGGIVFNGGSENTPMGDALIIDGGLQGAVKYGYTNAHDGAVVMSSIGSIMYSGVDAVLNTGVSSSTVFNLPAVSNSVGLSEDGSENGVSVLSGSSIPLTAFHSATGAVVINRGSATDFLGISALPDFGAALTVGTPALPFGSVRLNDSLNLPGALNISTASFSGGDGYSISALSGTLTLGTGDIIGNINGGLGLTKVGPQGFTLSGNNTYTGETFIQSGALVLRSALAAQFSTVRVNSDFALQFAPFISTYTIGGLAGTGDVPLTDNAASDNAVITLQVGGNGADTTYSGSLRNGGTLQKIGPGVLTLTGVNTHDNTIVESGTLQINSDKALGLMDVPGENEIIFHGGTLRASASLTINRGIFLESGAATFAAAPGKTLTLAGVIRGSGSFLLGDTGTVLLTNAANSNTGPVEIGGSKDTIINGVIISTPGAKGDIIITPGETPNTVKSIDVTNTNVPVTLVIKSPASGRTVTVEKIISNDTTPIKAITLNAGVILGDGLAGTPDLQIDGKLTKLQLADIRENTTIQLGQDLPYLDTYKNAPNITLTSTIGANLVIDVAGDGVTNKGVGGGGLGAVIVNKWDAPGGLIKTSQGIKSVLIKKGNFAGSIQIDPNHLGGDTTGSLGTLNVVEGSWTGTGMQVEGVVAQFLTKGLAEGSLISAGAFGKVKITGPFSGSIVANEGLLPATPLVKGKVVATGNIASVAVTGDLMGRIEATGTMGAITITGNFGGLINAEGKVGNVTVSGTGQFNGTLRGLALGNITANSFFGTAATQRHSITATQTIGNIIAKTGGMTDYLIAAGTDLGHDALFNGNELFTSTFAGVAGKLTAVSVGSVTVLKKVSGTTIAAGVNPKGTGVLLGVYGNLDDSLVALPAGATVKTKIGALKFETGALPAYPVNTEPGGAVANAFEAQSMTSLQVGKGQKPITDFTAAQFIDTDTTSIIVRLLT